MIERVPIKSRIIIKFFEFQGPSVTRKCFLRVGTEVDMPWEPGAGCARIGMISEKLSHFADLPDFDGIQTTLA